MDTGTSIPPQLCTGCAQPYVAIPIHINADEWVNPDFAITELTDWLNANCIKTAGPLFYRYHTLGNLNNLLSIEVGYPVTTQAQVCGRFIAGNIPQGTFATLVHCGYPGTFHTSLETMQRWAEQQGIQWKYSWQNGKQVWAGCFEFYLTNPADVPDKSQCRTAIALLTEQ